MITGSCALEGRQTLTPFPPLKLPTFCRRFPVTKSCSGREFLYEVTPSIPWGGRQTGFAGRQAASPYGLPGRPFHCTCRLLLARLLILATIVAAAFTLLVGNLLPSQRSSTRSSTVVHSLVAALTWLRPCLTMQSKSAFDCGLRGFP